MFISTHGPSGLFSIEYFVGVTYNPDQSLPKSGRGYARAAPVRTAKAIVPSVIWARTVPIPASPYRFFRSMFDNNRPHCRRYYGIDCQGDRDLALCICNFPLGYSPGSLYRKCFTGMLASGPSHSAYKWLIVCRALRSNLIAANAEFSICRRTS